MDIVRDILDRVTSALREGGFTDRLAEQIEQQVRQDWGGDSAYIAKTGEAAKAATSRRNAAILRDWRAGDRVGAIARKYQISRVRVWQIVNGC